MHLNQSAEQHVDEAESDLQVLVFVASMRCSETCHVESRFDRLPLGTGSERIDNPHRSICLPIGQVF